MINDKSSYQMALPPSKLPFFSIGVTLLVLFLIIVGSLGLILIQKPLQQQNNDLRGNASVANGPVILNTSPSPNTNLTTDQAAKIDVTLNTQNNAINHMTLVFHVVTATTDALNLQTYSNYNLEVTQQEVEQTADGFLVSYQAKPTNNGTLTSNSDQPVLSILFTPNKAGTFKLAFDSEKSTVTKVNGGGPEDVLRTVGTLEYLVQNNADRFAKTCNEPCSNSNECAVNNMCFENHCRLVTNVSSESCAAPANIADTGRTCNESCGSNSDCKAGLTCFGNTCRRPDNPDSTVCAVSSAELQTQIAQNCNQFCTDNHGCANNLRCDNNHCRLATNTSSTTCSAATKLTVSTQYYSTTTKTPTKGQELVTPPAASFSGKPTKPATASGSIATSSAGLVTPLPYVNPSPIPFEPETPIVTNNNGPLSGLQAMIATMSAGAGGAGRTMLVIFAAGLLILILGLVAILSRRRRPSSSTPPGLSASKATGSTNYEQELQTKINQLKQNGPPPTASAVVAPSPAQAFNAPLPTGAELRKPTTVAMTPRSASELVPPPPTLRPTPQPLPPTIQPAPIKSLRPQPFPPRPGASTPQTQIPSSSRMVSQATFVPAPAPKPPAAPIAPVMPFRPAATPPVTSLPKPASSFPPTPAVIPPAPRPAVINVPPTPAVINPVSQPPVQRMTLPIKPLAATTFPSSIQPSAPAAVTSQPATNLPPLAQPELANTSSSNLRTNSMLTRIRNKGITPPKPGDST